VDKDPAICRKVLPFRATEALRHASTAWYGPRFVRGAAKRRTAQAAGLAALFALAATSVSLASSGGGAPAQRLESKAHAALLDLYSLDSQLADAQTRVASLEAESTRLQRERATLQAELSAARGSLHVSQRELELRLRDLYEHGSVDPLAVILGSKSLDNAVNRLNALSSVADEAREVVAATRAARTRLSGARRTLAQQQRRLASALASARAAEAALAQTRAARLSYISQLRAQEQQAKVAALVAQAQTIQQKAQTLAPPQPTSTGGSGSTPSPPPAPAPPPSGGGRTLTVSASCYDLPGHTATGMPVGWGVVAVDPSVIPLGTKLFVPGYGNGVAADIGGGIKGQIIDLWMPPASCAKWGRRTVTITVY
jgi:3D (Asp-Asp-Asp) domain-containing protein/peptidoglycan hydrolase CwlO-like protein